jgi:UDP-N-acetylglucosamine--N-acetylmuramyl-(pentapeptide) pyrophosphoryl-undecaprenol N-acetylglucosamine transferase
MRIVFSGGGTGGHVFPAIAIADALKRKKPGADILFVGAKGKIEMDRVPKAGYPIKGLWISGFHRGKILKNLLFPFKLVWSLFRSWRILKKFNPDVVVGVGGFASGPTLHIASLMKIPTLIQEQNSYPGFTNKFLSDKVDKICVAYENMDRFFPKEKITRTGNPVREVISNLTVTKQEALNHFDLKEGKKTLLAFGGSLGAKSLNIAINNGYTLLKDRTDIQMIWQVGKLYYDEYKDSDFAKLDHVKVMPFIDRMDLAYVVSDLLMTRAGALTISEICSVGKPVILVPSPNVAEDHQTKNALAITEQNAAILIRDQNAKKRLMKEALDLIQDDETLNILASSIKKLGNDEADDMIADEVINLIGS